MDSDKLLAMIKERYMKTKEAVMLSAAYSMAEDGNEIRANLKRLHMNGMIIIDNGRIIPKISENEKPVMQEEVKLKEENIIEIIRDKGPIKPVEIFKEYTMLFGFVNPESLSRKVREMWKQEKVARNGECYFIDKKRAVEMQLNSFLSVVSGKTQKL